MLSVSSYISQLSGQGVASPNRYWVTFTMPSGIDLEWWGNASIRPESAEGPISGVNFALNSGSQLSMKCINMQMPSRALMTVENRHWGVPYKLPYSTMYDEAQFTFVGSTDLRERNFFEIWQEAVLNVNLNSLNFYEEYISTCQMYQLDKQNNQVYGIVLDQAYPINIGAVDYSYATQNDTVAVTVSLAYKRWRNLASFNSGQVR